MNLHFQALAIDGRTKARRGRFQTAHGLVETPVFMAVGTRASVKGLTPDQLREAGASIVLGNTYHLALRPGDELIRDLGGLHKFMAWDGTILTDSGGYQVFSLEELRKIDEDGVEFRSHIDGQWLRLSPERATQIQQNLGADIAMCFDECPPSNVDAGRIRQAVDRTTRWALRCRDYHSRSDQALFGIIQGGIDPALRQASAEGLVPLDFPGYAIGGLSVGETPDKMYATLDFSVPFLPENKPRYLMGVGTPIDLIEAVARGIDMFDCVMPTRNGRNASAFTSTGPIRLRNAIHSKDERPLDADCNCYTCRTFSRAYLRHLFNVDEMLGPILISLHNLAYYFQLMARIRASIESGSFPSLLAEIRRIYGTSTTGTVFESEAESP